MASAIIVPPHTATERYHRFSGAPLMTLTLRFAVNLSCIAFFGLHAQTLEVSPNRLMADESASIRATGLAPNERLSILAELVDGADARWTSQADFVADSEGRIDTSQQQIG